MSIGYAKNLAESMTKLGENNQGITLQPFELLDIARCIQELLDAQSAITIENFKRALDVALTGRKPSGLTREELRFFCLDVITEEDFTKGMPHMARFDSHYALMMTQMYITETGHQKIETAKSKLGEWPDPEPKSEMVVGKSYDCQKCRRKHPPGPCENFTGNPPVDTASEP